jgi:hypothetical protein
MDWSLVITLASILAVMVLVLYFFSKKNELKDDEKVQEAEVEEK